MALLETLRKVSADGDVDLLREGVRLLAQAIMEAEVSQLTGLAKGERVPQRRLTHRNGYRDRRWDTRVGTIDLAVPRIRDGSCLPSLLEPWRRAERALLGDGPGGIRRRRSTRRVDDLVRALGIDGISKSEVSPWPNCWPRPRPTCWPISPFPETHCRQIRSTNPLERINKEIKRRTRVVGIFPTRASALRLGMILAEQDDEWQDGRR